MSPAYEAEFTDFIVREMKGHVEVLHAPERLRISSDLVFTSPLIDLFILMPGNMLYRVNAMNEPMPWGASRAHAMWEAERVEKVEGTWKDGKGGHKATKVMTQA